MKNARKGMIENYTKKCSEVCIDNNIIDSSLYDTYKVKRGLRDKSGKGVLSGLTNISSVQAYKEVDGKTVPCDGKLLYRGYNIIDLVKGFSEEKRYGFEETAYLLLFGSLPDEEQLEEFKEILASCRNLPKNFVKDVVMKAPTKDIMNSLTRSVLTLASYDERVSDLSLDNVLRQCLILSVLSYVAIYGYHAYNHYERNDSFYIHRPDEKLSATENILRMLRPDKQYTELEASVLDIALVLHMEHGGGNNSTFTTRGCYFSRFRHLFCYCRSIVIFKGPNMGSQH